MSFWAGNRPSNLATLTAQRSLTFSLTPSCSLSSLTVLANTDRSMSNNQIELLNKGKSIITIDFILLVIERQTL